MRDGCPHLSRSRRINRDEFIAAALNAERATTTAVPGIKDRDDQPYSGPGKDPENDLEKPRAAQLAAALLKASRTKNRLASHEALLRNLFP